MYKLEFLPIAKDDMDNIIYYISNNLKNSAAARNLAESFISGADNILMFPYGSPIYKLKGTLKNKYRSIKIKNFLMFYQNPAKKIKRFCLYWKELLQKNLMLIPTMLI